MPYIKQVVSPAILDNEIKKIEDSWREQLAIATNEELLEQFRIDFLGRHGKIALLMDQLKTLSVEEKKQAGPLLNQLKKFHLIIRH